MRRIRTRIQKRDREKVPEVFPVASSLESRAFDPEAESAEIEEIPEVQMKEEQQDNFGYNLANIPLSAKKTEEEETPKVQAKDEEDTVQLKGEDNEDLAEFIPEEEEEAPQVQKDEESEQQAKSDSESEELKEQAKELYEQFLAGEEAAIAMLEDSGLNLTSLETLSAEEAIGQIQAILETPVAA